MTGGGGWDDTRPVGVPARFRGQALEGTADAALQADEDIDAGLERIAAHDPNFDIEAFKSSVETLFFVVQEAWLEDRPELVRTVMAEDLAAPTVALLEEYRKRGLLRMLEGIAVGEVDVVGVHSDARWDTVTVRFRVVSADYDIEATSGRYAGGDREQREYWEDWLFQRASSARTPPGGGTMNRRCPNCQAPLDIDDAGTCQFCKASVMSGGYDWVLTRIDRVRGAPARF